MEGTLFDIQRFSVHDGPGIRTVVFFKGCMLNCIWCHNPESKSIKAQLKFLEHKCTMCRLCETVCTWGVHEFHQQHSVNFDLCHTCGRCAQVCPHQALEMIGRQMTVDDLLMELEKDRPYFEKSQGGITLSGGEIFSQPEFAIAVAKGAKERGLHVVVETSGYGSEEMVKKIAPYVDQFYFDYKQTDAQLHKHFIGVDREVILRNLDILFHMKKDVVLRCPLVPGCNDHDQHFKGIAQVYQKYPNISRVEILPYHRLGQSKAKHIGYDYQAKDILPPSLVEIDMVIDKLKQYGVTHIKKG